MSTVEQWTEFCEQLGQSTIGMQTRHEDYRGFVLKACVTRIDEGFSMQTRITPPNAGTVQEIIRTPPWDPQRFDDADDALAALLDFGKAIVNGGLADIDPLPATK